MIATVTNRGMRVELIPTHPYPLHRSGVCLGKSFAPLIELNKLIADAITLFLCIHAKVGGTRFATSRSRQWRQEVRWQKRNSYWRLTPWRDSIIRNSFNCSQCALMRNLSTSSRSSLWTGIFPIIWKETKEQRLRRRYSKTWLFRFVTVYCLIVIVIVISKDLKRHSIAKRMAPAY